MHPSSEEDKGGKMAAADSSSRGASIDDVNQQSSSGMDTEDLFFLSACPNKVLKIKNIQKCSECI